MPTAEVHDTEPGLALHGHVGLVMRREGNGQISAWIPVRPDLAPGGRMPLGTIGFVCDVVGGHVAGLAVVPKWVVTTDLDVRRVGGAHVTGPLWISGSVVRAGRTSVVAAMEVRDVGAGGRLVAVASVASTPLDANFEPFAAQQADGVAFGNGLEPDSPPPFQEFLGLVAHGDSLVFDMPPLARNPWGVMHGGAVVEAIAAVGASAARRGLGDEAVLTALHTRFVNGARVGPFEVNAHAAGPVVASTSGPVRVEVTDRGADRTVATGVVEARAAVGGVDDVAHEEVTDG